MHWVINQQSFHWDKSRTWLLQAALKSHRRKQKQRNESDVAAAATAALKAEQKRARKTFHVGKRCFHFAPATSAELTTTSWRVWRHPVAKKSQSRREKMRLLLSDFNAPSAVSGYFRFKRRIQRWLQVDFFCLFVSKTDKYWDYATLLLCTASYLSSIKAVNCYH